MQLIRLSMLFLVTVISAAAFAAPVKNASDWSGDARSSARLIAAAMDRDTGALRAGIELRLKPGWITYWRYPGDAGIPPRFDFSGSENLQSAQVSWPAPKRIEKGGAESIGYDGDVTFPLRVVAKNANRPVTLKLKLDYGVCEKLCVPASAEAALTLAGASGIHEAALRAAEASVPQPVAVGPREGIAITRVTRDGNRVVIAVDGPVTDLFAEGPTADWALPLPKKDGAQFAFVLDGAPPGVSYDGATLRLTAVGPAGAIEAVTRLD